MKSRTVRRGTDSSKNDRNSLFRTGSLPEAHGLYDPEFEHDSCGVGFVAHIKGERSHQIVLDADEMLRHMTHRGACGCEENTGDGAGILVSMPHEFLSRVVKQDLDFELPQQGNYGMGVVFLPTDVAQREHCKKVVEEAVHNQGLVIRGWRELPVSPEKADIGPSAVRAMPHMEQVFISTPNGKVSDQDDLERQLYIILKLSSRQLREGDLPQGLMFYFCSLSTKVVVYKGMLTPDQVMPFYPDLQDEDFKSHLAMVHSRFSTNTFPSWDRAQPCRFMAHNGEINTLRGNANWMYARQGKMSSDLFGSDINKLFPIIEPHCSDSGNFDNALELLLMSGRPLPEVMMMMIPEAWQNHHSISVAKRAFYEYYSSLQEPWDGPASVSFTDGQCIGAVLDRNGLRPSRYYVTHDDRVIMASEVGVLEVDPKIVKEKGRLQPGKMFLVDFEEGRLIPDEELKEKYATKRPYHEWLQNQRIHLQDIPPADELEEIPEAELLSRMQAFGFTFETLRFMLIPLIKAKKDPIGSMGNDAALACLSDQSRLLYDYFHQLFAQVTNPAIDSIREEVIMSLECYIGPEGNLLESTESQCHRLLIPEPIISNKELAAIKSMNYRGWKNKTIDVTYPKSEGEAGFRAALDRIREEASQAIVAGFSLVTLSDRAVNKDRIALPTLISCGAIHHHLVRNEQRTQIGIVLETGEAREVHHHCLLFGYGADAINPYMAFESLWHSLEVGELDAAEWDRDSIVAAYRMGVSKGMLKVMAKMGISTLQSYKGAQIFEAVGLNQEVIDACFAGTASRIKGIGFDVITQECEMRHEIGYPERDQYQVPGLQNPGVYHWRANGEKHSWSPENIANLQAAASSGDKNAYKQFAKEVNEQTTRDCHLRGLLTFKSRTSIPLEEVEPVEEIVKRFCTGAMSYGSISAEAHESLAIAMNRLGGKSNTGEGGEDYSRFTPLENKDSKRSAIKQIASGRFGVTSWYLTNADELQIKISQGAKPGEGGELPGHKVNKIIASVRHSTPGVGLISPPPHHDIYSIEDLSQLIYDLKNSNPSARISVKLVSEVGVGTIASGVAKGHADNILISGASGGTGASPLTSVKHAGLPWELGIAETHQTLVMNDLRSRVRLQTDGQLKTGRDVVIANLLGAEEFGFSTGPLITMGCIMMRKCHLNTCPVGIATQNPELRKKFAGQPDHVVNYFFLLAQEARELMAELGFRTMDEMVGRSDVLELDEGITHWKAKHLDLTPILRVAEKPHPDVGTFCTRDQEHGLEIVLDNVLIDQCQPAIKNGEPVVVDIKLKNTDRTFGTMLSHEVSKHNGPDGLPDETIHINSKGSAGQSLGAWLAHGITIEHEGDANDYVGKGLSGGRIIIYPPVNSTFLPQENIIVGNVNLYGATEGEVYIRGQAAERFCVRNSGAHAVVEGIGDHGCEYMTGGRAVILGETGRNFAAGMSGGVSYVYDPHGLLLQNCNLETVALESVKDVEDIAELKTLIDNHRKFTGSTVAKSILDNWVTELEQFKKVMPIDYKRALEELAAEEAEVVV
ncbi:MAG: glutamate synthase large subunit [Planctomycetes bacterium]|nr:glutamate synthase large subunit [Planctomycetota bacterium]MCH9777382.1 glutamate synthase large subunit [Planctomycetota bacterium]MCH9789313.1 glutamate synthase large subunit [Planctomycetota bacterium]